MWIAGDEKQHTIKFISLFEIWNFAVVAVHGVLLIHTTVRLWPDDCSNTVFVFRAQTLIRLLLLWLTEGSFSNHFCSFFLFSPFCVFLCKVFVWTIFSTKFIITRIIFVVDSFKFINVESKMEQDSSPG